MAGFNWSVTFPKMTKAKFERELYTKAQLAFKRAAKAYLVELIAVWPVWTGFSQGAFRNLAEFAGRYGTGSIPWKKRNARAKRRWYYKGVERTDANGRQFSTSAAEVLGSVQIAVARVSSSIQFAFTVDIDYLDHVAKARMALLLGDKRLIQLFEEEFAKIPIDYKLLEG